MTMPSVQLPILFTTAPVQESHGAVYTKPWVVDVVLDMAGYVEQADLGILSAVEPAVGDGVFVAAMARRLAASCLRHGRDVRDCETAIRGFDLNPRSVKASRSAAVAAMSELGIESHVGVELAEQWICQGNYLFDAPTLPLVDFVIGNPPYIRLEEIGDEIAATYRAMYRTMKGRADIYIAFFEAALRQLKLGGVCAYICADRWMLNQFGGELRAFVTSSFGVETVIEMHTANAFESDVSAYPAITVIRRAPQGTVIVARADSIAETVGAGALSEALITTRTDPANGKSPAGLSITSVETWFDGSAPWPCTSPERLKILRQLEERFSPLESVETGTKVGIGVASGCDEIFITMNADLVESERLLPLAMGPDTLDGTLKWSGHYLVDPWTLDGLVNLVSFPRLSAYFNEHQHRLLHRHVVRSRPEHWYRTIDRVTHALTTRPKLYFPDIKNRIHPVLDTGQTYPHHNLYYIQSDVWDLEVLGGLLLSDVGQFFVECYGVRMRGGWLRFQAQYLRRIRVPSPQNILDQHAAALKEAFRQRDQTAATRIALGIYHLDQLPMGAD